MVWISFSCATFFGSRGLIDLSTSSINWDWRKRKCVGQRAIFSSTYFYALMVLISASYSWNIISFKRTRLGRETLIVWHFPYFICLKCTKFKQMFRVYFHVSFFYQNTRLFMNIISLKTLFKWRSENLPPHLN